MSTPPKMALTGAVGGTPAPSAGDSKDISVFVTPGGRLQITADVGAEGVVTLKKMLDKYEEILKMLS